VYELGDRVVHRRQGAGEVVGRTGRMVGGAEREYLEIRFAHDDLTMLLPVEEADGLRPVADEASARAALEVLGEPPSPPAGPQGRTQRDRERLSSGDLLVIAALVRDLTHRREGSRRRLGRADLEALDRGMALLVAEIGLALGLSQDEAKALVDERLEEALRP
jgi:CarD family transcriptional regulator, regulator of rRNA transcription